MFMFPRYNEKLSHYFIFNIKKGNYYVISCFYVKKILNFKCFHLKQDERETIKTRGRI